MAVKSLDDSRANGICDYMVMIGVMSVHKQASWQAGIHAGKAGKITYNCRCSFLREEDTGFMV